MKSKIASAFVMTIAMLSALPVEAAFLGGVTIDRLRVHNGFAYVQTSVFPSKNACDLYSEYYKFDVKTEEGKAYLSALLAAKTTGAVVDVWYSISSAPGENQTSGCNENTVSTLQGVRLK